MRWYHYLAYFFGGAFLTNAVPHFINGVSATPFKALSRIRPVKGWPCRIGPL